VGAGATANVDSARANLAGTFVNAGFGNDKLMVEAEEGNSWIYKNKDHGICIRRITLPIISDIVNRHDERGCESWAEFVVGYRCRPEPRRQIYLLFRRTHQGRSVIRNWPSQHGCLNRSGRRPGSTWRLCRQQIHPT
jgi:hypothetical protein